MWVYRILGLGIRPCACDFGLRLPVGSVQANPSGPDRALVLGVGPPVGGVRGKLMSLPWFGASCLRPPLQGVGPRRHKVRFLLSRSFGLTRV